MCCVSVHFLARIVCLLFPVRVMSVLWFAYVLRRVGYIQYRLSRARGVLS